MYNIYVSNLEEDSEGNKRSPRDREVMIIEKYIWKPSIKYTLILVKILQ